MMQPLRYSPVSSFCEIVLITTNKYIKGLVQDCSISSELGGGGGNLNTIYWSTQVGHDTGCNVPTRAISVHEAECLFQYTTA